MKYQPIFILLTLFCVFIIYAPVFASQKAKIIGEVVEIYQASDFDSDVIDEVYKGDVYPISDKTQGPFYKIKLKNGKVGYIVDYELDIEGKGRLKPKDLDELEMADQINFLKKHPPQNSPPDEEELAVFGKPRNGPVLQLINFHESTMGGEKIDDLVAVGYKSISTLAWSAVGSFTVPKYYTQPTGQSGQGFKLWADIGFSNTIATFSSTELRFSGNIFTHFSYLKIETPIRKYDLQDITMGVNLESALLIKFRRFAVDLGLKYYFDKSNYAGLSLACLF